MYVILTYDVVAKRVSKVMKTCRKYMVHVQKSVFEGWMKIAKSRSISNLFFHIFKNADFTLFFGVSRK